MRNKNYELHTKSKSEGIMSFKRTSLSGLILIIGTLFQEIETLPVKEGQTQLLKNSTSSFAVEETLSTPTNGSLSLLANETLTSPAEEQLSSSISEAPLPADSGALSPSVNDTLPSLSNETLLSPAEEPILSSVNETLSPSANRILTTLSNETLSLPAEEPLLASSTETQTSPAEEQLSSSISEAPSPANNKILSPSANRILPTLSNETLSLPAEDPLLASSNETLSAAENKTPLTSANGTLSSNGTLSPPLNETQSSANGRLSAAAKRTLTLPKIVYGPINQQLGNKYLPAEQGQDSDDEPVAPGSQVIYGSTTSQNNNRYMTIAQAEHVYLMVPTIDEPLPISVPGLPILQNISTSGLIFNVNDPMGKRIEDLITTFNAFQQSFDRIVRLASPFLTDNEINPLLRKRAKDDSIRQTIEIEWLTTVASHRMKFIKLYKLLSFTYNKLKLKSKVTNEDLYAAKRRKHGLVHSEEKLKKKTQDFVVYVLSK